MDNERMQRILGYFKECFAAQENVSRSTCEALFAIQTRLDIEIYTCSIGKENFLDIAFIRKQVSKRMI